MRTDQIRMKDLFAQTTDPRQNLLPQDGAAYYLGVVLSPEETSHYIAELTKNIAWRRDDLVLFGKKITTKRKVAWYGDEPFAYRYSGMTKTALAWTAELLELKVLVEGHTRKTYNSCLLNLYHDGCEGMGWHSDDEPDLKREGAIASVSLGATRKFVFRHKASKEKISVVLENGSLLLMAGATQQYWSHSLPPTRRVLAPRINLTFRTIANPR